MQELNVDQDTTLINMAVLPPEPTSIEVQRLSADLHPVGGLFVVDGAERFPHLTLFMARFVNSDIDSILETATSCAASLRPVTMVHCGYFLTPGNYFEVSYQRTDGVMGLHEQVTHTLAPHRFSPGRPVREKYFGPYSAEQREQAETWGYDLAGDLFRPHITVTRFGEPPTVELPDAGVDLSFQAVRIGLFKADELGAVTETLATWELG